MRDLELTEPGLEVPGSELRKTIYHNGILDDSLDENKQGKAKDRKKVNGDEGMAKVKKEKRKRNVRTFFLFLLLGFLVGLAAILFVWFLILR